jgi:LPXTG-motif cell wall-anchored protein
MKKLVSLLATFLLLFGFTNVGYAADDKNCDDFSSQEEAQNYYESNDPDADPSGLDRDNDGEACETYSYSGSDSSDEEAASSDDSAASDEEMTSEEDSSEAADSAEGAEMADTATSYPVYMLLGLAIAAFGSLLLLKRRVHS